MNTKAMMRCLKVAAAGVLAAALCGCNGGELTRSAAPVDLVVTNTQDIFRIDLAGNAPGSTACDQNLGTIEMKAIVKSAGSSDNRFNDVRVTRYRVSYVRTDGGRQVPSPFVRSIDTLLTANGSAQGLTRFQVVEQEALNQAPFAALLPQNGGRDPETGRTVVHMDVIVEIFGQTLAGENVSASTRFPLDFCFSCNGCG
jgi:hypothetical protein